MTGTALTRPGQRERLPVKLAEIDWRLVGLLCLVAGVGAMMLYSLGGTSWEPWAANHVLRVGVCVVIMLVLSLVNLRIWFATAYPIYFAALVLLVAVELFGYTVNNAKSWLDLGVTRIQPSELMKIGVVLALARWYHGASAQDARLSWKLIIPAAIIGVPVLLVADQPDLGTAMLIAMTGGAMMFMAGLSWRLVAAAAAAAAVAIPLFVQFVLHEYQRQRVLTFLTPEADPPGRGYHIMQSKIAMGSGGFLGKGFGLGSQSQLEFLPEKQTDFIFAALAEEFGFVGSFSVLLIYAAIIVIALRIATLSHSHFGRMAAAGVTATFAVYILINGAMVMGLAPVVGVPMPLLSYGGTVLLTVMVGFGLIQAVRVHRYLELPKGRGLF
ncbi:LOW QUALITY PROTEIN: rod shape-determining protein rodA [Brevundimonas abyssalis TAR-001]|uniref:Peptidoglycan glycosyltransferase MrdB n=1 Tax=Brevundimonas abyssalis TAR-001 TaxID=1391729 RepID=A0A8E0NAW4_9CAUL|nr:LOW QUALITY PROTEIN: rod shape-determining protein rodA [Brevundimonas abyssalis TAR-001]